MACQHTIGTAVDEDGCCISCGEDLNYIAIENHKVICPVCGNDVVTGTDTEETECPNCTYQFKTPWGRIKDAKKVVELQDENNNLNAALDKFVHLAQQERAGIEAENKNLKVENKILIAIKEKAYEACCTGDREAELTCIRLCDGLDKAALRGNLTD